jgi:hypothetical protein
VPDEELHTLGVVHPARADGPSHMRVHRLVYAATTAALGALLVLALLDIKGPVLGVDSTVVTDRGADGVVLSVQYPEVTRPALASPFAVEVTKVDGFDEPIELAISRPWIEVWDENGLYPSPDAESGNTEWVVYEFAPPDDGVFRFFYDARLEPARQEGVSGTVELREDGVAIASVDFHTAVRP